MYSQFQDILNYTKQENISQQNDKESDGNKNSESIVSYHGKLDNRHRAKRFKYGWEKQYFYYYILCCLAVEILDNLAWFRNNYCRNIATFFEEMERKLATIRFTNLDTEDNSYEGTIISRLMGNAAVGCDNYVFSGQCIVANFGFVREQGMHLAFDPKTG